MASVGKALLTALGEHVVFQSILHCRKDKHSWKERYAVLYKNTTFSDHDSSKLKSSHTMKIFSDMAQTKTKYIIHTNSIEKIITSSSDDNVEDDDLSFAVVSTDDQPLLLRANTHEELSIWVATLLVAVGKGKYYYVRHYDKDHSSTMHSILYFTEKHNKDTGSNDCFFVLSSPLNDKEIRKLWNINEIKQCVRTANGITIECCPKCHKKGEIFNRKFTMFMPADRVSSCLRYICKATQFNQTFSNEKKLTGCENDEVHKYCSPAHEYDEVKDNTSEQTISIEPDGYITMRRMDKTMEASSSTSSGEQTGLTKQDDSYVDMTQSKLLSEKIVCKEKDDDNLCQKHPNTDVRLYVNVPGQLAPETLPSMDVIPSCNDHSLQHPSQSVPTSPFIMDSSLTSQQLGKNNEKIMCPNDVDVCQEQPVQEFKPTPKPRKKKMNCTPIQDLIGGVDVSGSHGQEECSDKSNHCQILQLETNK